MKIYFFIIIFSKVIFPIISKYTMRAFSAFDTLSGNIMILEDHGICLYNPYSENLSYYPLSESSELVIGGEASRKSLAFVNYPSLSGNCTLAFFGSFIYVFKEDKYKCRRYEYSYSDITNIFIPYKAQENYFPFILATIRLKDMHVLFYNLTFENSIKWEYKKIIKFIKFPLTN